MPKPTIIDTLFRNKNKKMKSLLIVLLFTLFSCSTTSRVDRLKNQSDEIISRIEAIKNVEHKLPSSLSEIGINKQGEASEISYERVGSSRYVLWFLVDSEQAFTYDSATKTWERKSSKGTALHN